MVHASTIIEDLKITMFAVYFWSPIDFGSGIQNNSWIKTDQNLSGTLSNIYKFFSTSKDFSRDKLYHSPREIIVKYFDIFQPNKYMDFSIKI